MITLAVDRHGNPMQIEWPPNIGMVNSFVACFDQSYEAAYIGCTPGEPTDSNSVR